MESQYSATTLRHLLCQQKPTIRRGAKLIGNTTNVLWPELKDITVWHDFTLESLNESYGYILDTDIWPPVLKTPQPAALEGVVTSDDKDIRHLIGWHDAMMQQTLRFAKRQLGICRSKNLTFSCSTPDKSFITRLPTVSTQILVDHIIGIDDPFQPVLVVGLGRLSTKWSCTKLLDDLENPNLQKQWPVRQLANICKKARTRYGYIQTEDELVVCCFSESAGGLKAAIMPIPWTRHGIYTLTTELALWWLCMLALATDPKRDIVAEEDVVRINHWDEVQLNGRGGWVLCHRYSNYIKPQYPSVPPPTYSNFEGPKDNGALPTYSNFVKPEDTTAPLTYSNLEHPKTTGPLLTSSDNVLPTYGLGAFVEGPDPFTDAQWDITNLDGIVSSGQNDGNNPNSIDPLHFDPLDASTAQWLCTPEPSPEH